MTFSDRGKFWFIFALIVITGFLGGILGNWIFIYLLDKYYAIPGGNYLAAPSSSDIVIRRASPTAAETDNFAQTVRLADASLAGVFRLPAEQTAAEQLRSDWKIGQAAVLTSDGWLVTPTAITPSSTGSFDSYRVVASDRRSYAVEKVIFDEVSQLYFIRLENVQNLPVREFLMSRELAPGQAVVGVEYSGTVETGRLSRLTEGVRSADRSVTPLAVTGLGDRNLYLFDAEGRMIGLTRGRNAIAMDSVKLLTDRLLVQQQINRPYLGINYLDLSVAPASDEVGALLAADGESPAVMPDSPAEKAGLRAGDVLTSFDGISLGQFSNLAALLLEYDPGDTVTVSFVRGGASQEVEISLGSLPLN